ncbi:MAG TPA: class I SAM-dependent methyltransferase, partial [Candidatus Angelobacter sp.]|nr:class I SAM-dependent methyltransferase [Candidatus Angelobacter sp.]
MPSWGCPVTDSEGSCLIATQSVEAVFHSPSMMKILKSGELESYQQQLRQCRIKGVYDWNKAFDCINSIQALKELGIGSRDRIISLGAYHDSSLQILDALGYEKLYGIDKNSDIYNNHNYNRIRYFWGNIENTHFPGSFFDCGVCLSVIEHHVNHEDFLSETYRILKPGSPLIVSTDFFPEKIHLAFGNRARQKLGRLSWKVFSTNELLDFIDLAGRRGFVPLFDVDELRSYKIRDRPIKHLGVQYTFAFMVFRRRNEIPVRPRGGSGISILLPCNPNEIGGISIYSNLLVRRFSKAGIESEVVYNPAQARYDKVLIEASHGLSGSNELPAIIGKLQRQR